MGERCHVKVYHLYGFSKASGEILTSRAQVAGFQLPTRHWINLESSLTFCSGYISTHELLASECYNVMHRAHCLLYSI